MQEGRRIGIWMDHASAHLTEVTDPMTTTIIQSASTHEVKEQALQKGEHLAHNKDQHQLATFYQSIADTIATHDAVLIFGPTDAKSELLNVLRADHRFDKIKMEVKPADKMTEHQQHAFVKAHFSTH